MGHKRGKGGGECELPFGPIQTVSGGKSKGQGMTGSRGARKEVAPPAKHKKNSRTVVRSKKKKEERVQRDTDRRWYWGFVKKKGNKRGPSPQDESTKKSVLNRQDTWGWGEEIRDWS